MNLKAAGRQTRTGTLWNIADRLRPAVREQVVPVIQALSSNPRPEGAKKLRGSSGFWRVRSGDYRIIYEIESGRVMVLVLRVRHRSRSTFGAWRRC